MMKMKFLAVLCSTLLLTPLLRADDKTAAPATPAPVAPADSQIPDVFQVEFDTTKGKFIVEVQKAWAPVGAERFYNLVKEGYYTDIAFFRVLKGFVAQFGIHGKPEVAKKWGNATIKDDKVAKSNLRGYITFATAGPNTRTTQLFINLADNARLDGMGFSPFAQVVGEGMKVVDQFYADYGEGAPNGGGPAQDLMEQKGNTYLREKFSKLDYLKSAKILEAKK